MSTHVNHQCSHPAESERSLASSVRLARSTARQNFPKWIVRLLGLVALFLPAAPAATAPVAGGDAAGAPAVNWVLPIFSDKEGYRSMTLRGSEVRPLGRSIAVTDLSITIFSGDARTTVDSMLLSPSAVFLPKENRATGEKSVRFIRDDIEVTGVGWTYEHTAKKVTLAQNVRVTFRAQMKDILK